MAQTGRNLPAMQGTWEDPLEKEMATHSSILAWKIPWIEEPDELQSPGSQRISRIQLSTWAWRRTECITTTTTKACPASFLEHRASFLLSILNSFRECWRSAAAAAHELILVEIEGKQPQQVPIYGWQTSY